MTSRFAADSSRTLLVIVTALACCGCSGGDELFQKRGKISGKVTFDGQPLESGRITFTALGKEGTITGADIKDGAYTIPREQGPVAGQQKVTISASRKTGQKIPAPMPAPPGQMLEVEEEYIPRKYNVESNLTADTKPGDNPGVDFTLTKD